MEIQFIDDGINAVIIDNFYTKEQLDRIWIELNWLTRPEVLRQDNLAMGQKPDGSFASKKHGVFLNEVFCQSKHSSMATCTENNIKSSFLKGKLLEHNTGLYKCLYMCNHYGYLLSYYENAQYYEPHIDSSFFTILSYFHKEPKQFDGGEVILHSYTSEKKATVEPSNNRVVIIPSCTVHEVTPIVSDYNNSYSGNGRYCSAAFVRYFDEREVKQLVNIHNLEMTKYDSSRL